jgi:hypothetical protein
MRPVQSRIMRTEDISLQQVRTSWRATTMGGFAIVTFGAVTKFCRAPVLRLLHSRGLELLDPHPWSAGISEVPCLLCGGRVLASPHSGHPGSWMTAL